MNKYRFTYCFLLITLLVNFTKASVPDSLIGTLDFSAVSKKRIQINDGKKKIESFNQPLWLYFNYDNPALRNNNPADTGYSIYGNNLGAGLNFTFGKDKSLFEIFEGTGWFKCYFKVPLAQTKRIYNNYISLHGAAEVFLDGIKVSEIGKINSKGISVDEKNVSGRQISFFISDTLTHCLAVKLVFSNIDKYYKTYRREIEPPGFEFSDPEITSENNISLSIYYSVTNMLAAFFFALFILHLLIYLFYREKSFNLLYSLFLFLLSLSFLQKYLMQYVEDLYSYLWIANAERIIFPAVCFLLVTLLNRLLNEKSSWHYKGLTALIVYLVIDTFLIHRYGRMVAVTIYFYTYFNTLAHSIKGIRRKVASAKFLGWGILSFTLSIVLLVLSTIVWSLISVYAAQSNAATIVYAFLLILSVLSIPLSMSAYLAYDFSRTNSSLKLQLKQNQELSDKTIKQEKEKQEILENQKKVLEDQVKERTKEIADQNKQLEHQKKEITDSITYAKRIQTALLPELSEIKAKLPNSFILYLPKDIVSGDFYFYQSIDNKSEHPGREAHYNDNGIYIAAADCTGHGVPGALMSMIVHEKLEAATKIYSQPKEILKSINKQVKDALKQYQNEGGSRDGCDIAFLKLTDNKVSYSGAYRPLYYFRKDGSFNEIKATKTAIAGLTPYNQEFDQHELNTDDIQAIYLFSDGFADQFGGEKTKKLTTKKFKELLASIVKLPADEQKSRLESFFTDWKGKVEQIDDVLIIGLLF